MFGARDEGASGAETCEVPHNRTALDVLDSKAHGQHATSRRFNYSYLIAFARDVLCCGLYIVPWAREWLQCNGAAAHDLRRLAIRSRH